MSTNTWLSRHNCMLYRSKGYLFMGRAFSSTFFFKTPGSQEVLCSVSMIRLKLWPATIIIKCIYKKTTYSKKKWNNRGLLK